MSNRSPRRHWDLVHTDQYDLQGVTLLKYQWAPGTLGNASVDPDEAYAYANGGPSGLLNLSSCYWGAPVYLSKPRFMDGSPSLRDAVVGLGPVDPQAHDTWLGVEPTAGQTLDFHWRIAANMYLAPIPGDDPVFPFTFFPGVIPVYLPLLWAERFGTADSGQIADFTGRVYFAQDLMAGAKYGGLALAVVSGLVALASGGVAWRRKRDLDAARVSELEYYRALLAGYDAGGDDDGAGTTADGATPVVIVGAAAAASGGNGGASARGGGSPTGPAAAGAPPAAPTARTGPPTTVRRVASGSTLSTAISSGTGGAGNDGAHGHAPGRPSPGSPSLGKSQLGGGPSSAFVARTAIGTLTSGRGS